MKVLINLSLECHTSVVRNIKAILCTFVCSVGQTLCGACSVEQTDWNVICTLRAHLAVLHLELCPLLMETITWENNIKVNFEKSCNWI
jgi:hypothetical protein